MNDGFALQPVLDQAKEEAQASLARLAAIRRTVAEAEEKLRQLTRYREIYRSDLRRSSADGMNIDQLRNYGEFTRNLDRALSQAEAQLADCRSKEHMATNEWQRAHQRLTGLDALLTRHHAARARDAARRDQKQQDEIAARSHRFRRSA